MLTQDISVVVQGGICPNLTLKCVTSIRKHLPDAEIILSTWQGSDTQNINYDILLLNKKPTSYLYDDIGKKSNNVNYQIVSTVNGINKSQRKYILKLRSDFILTGTHFLKFWTKFSKADKQYQIYNQKIINCSFFTRDPKVTTNTFLFHPSDIALFGLKEDMLKFFNVPLMTEKDEYFVQDQHGRYCKFTPEQHLFINSLRQHGHKIEVEHQKDITNTGVVLTEKYLANNFILISWAEFNIRAPQKFYNFEKNDYHTCITYVEWQQLYQKYIDPSLTVPDFDPIRHLLNLNIKRINLKKYKRIANYISCLIPITKIRKSTRHKLLFLMVQFFKKRRDEKILRQIL